MRYLVAIQLDTDEIVEPAKLACLREAIAIAKRLAGGGWWEVYDVRTGNIIASSDSEANYWNDDND